MAEIVDGTQHCNSSGGLADHRLHQSGRDREELPAEPRAFGAGGDEASEHSPARSAGPGRDVFYWLRVFGLPIWGTVNDQLKTQDLGVDAMIS
jgi:hypothetical protein